MTSRFSFSCLIALVSIISLSSCHRTHPLSRKEASDRLKVLNSDLISLVDSSSERKEIKALRFLWNQNSSPLPIRSDSARSYLKNLPYSFEEKKGVYQWDSIAGKFIRLRDTTAVVLYFTLPDHPRGHCCFILSEYSTEKIRSRPDFPVRAEARLLINDKEMLYIHHKARIEENLFSDVETKVGNDQYLIRFTLSRTGTFRQKSGTLKCAFTLRAGFSDILSTKMDCSIDYHLPSTYSFREIRIDQEAFGTRLSGTINYANISPTSEHYADEFNRNSNLELMDDEQGFIGNIVLKEVKETDKLDFFIQYPDKTVSLLSENILLVKKLFNLKY